MMAIYTDMRNLPGPGDEATWGPCTNHPNDPRTPDWSGDIEDKKTEMTEERIRDIDGYFIEAFTEANDEMLKNLSDAILADDPDKDYIAELVINRVVDYCTPDDQAVIDQIAEDSYWADYDGC